MVNTVVSLLWYLVYKVLNHRRFDFALGFRHITAECGHHCERSLKASENEGHRS